MARILLIDDDEDFSCLLRDALEERGHDVACLDQAERGPDLLAQGGFDVVLLDNKMPRMSGIEFLEALQRRGSRVPVILMTSHGTTATAIQAMNLGAFDYVIKPLDYEVLCAELEPLIAQAVEITRATRERVRLPGESSGDGSAGPLLLGSSKPMLEVYKLIGRFARSSAAALVLGETGTGKELVVRALHSHSARKDRPLVALNCNAPNERALDDELFGHEAGAFPGADKLRKGAFEHANGGTLFLDKVEDMPLSLQAKVLRVLESREFCREGSSEPIALDIRLLASTRHDIEAAVRAGRFREDLFYRLNEVTIRVPPLRERGADLQLLAEHLLALAAQEAGRPTPTLSEGAGQKLRGHPWPGNVRELQNVLRRAVLVAQGPCLLPADLELGPAADAPVPGAPAQGTDSLEQTQTHPGSAGGEEEALAGLRQAVRWALQSGRPNPSQLLHELLDRELAAHSRTTLDSGPTFVGGSLAAFVEGIRASGILEPEQQEELGRLVLRFGTPQELPDELRRRGWLTPWQLAQLAAGRGRDLVLGQYVLLDLLGEGGMGSVFKARQRRLKRLTAVKVIRPERLSSPGAVQRFHREIEAAARLSHPNIVRIYDADEVRGRHFLAMEYVEGTDLGCLLRSQGTLAVPAACDYIRQAALGLQHAHELHLVHRDIKPSNLLLSAQGVLKILDMGLARLGPIGEHGLTEERLTQSGAVMGTPDYIAPEQARDARAVDIRADLYSLGCTLYHCLTGSVPFAGTTLAQKLLQHQLEEPPAVEALRPGLPPALARLVRRLMSKRPEERYQCPAEVVAALEALAPPPPRP